MNNKPQSHSSPAARRPPVPLWLAGAAMVVGLGCIVIIVTILISGDGGSTPAPVPAPAPSAGNAAPSAKPDPSRILGRWLRPDGGYILEIASIGEGGKLTAAYYNPRPINVAKAQLTESGGGIKVFVELRDTNYPGNYYDLSFDPAQNVLRGTYTR